MDWIELPKHILPKAELESLLEQISEANTIIIRRTTKQTMAGTLVKYHYKLGIIE